MEEKGIVILLDCDVLVEAQRGRPEAAVWLRNVTDVALPAPVAWEMLFGSRDKQELTRSQRFLESFAVEPITPEDSDLAQKLIVAHVLKSGLSLPDFLIAAQALNRAATLYTFNRKHFSAIPKLDVREPYRR